MGNPIGNPPYQLNTDSYQIYTRVERPEQLVSLNIRSVRLSVRKNWLRYLLARRVDGFIALLSVWSKYATEYVVQCTEEELNYSLHV